MEEKVQGIIEILKNRYADAPCALHYQKDYELMIAVRLSAQCTDARVNLVTPALFAAYPTLEAMAAAPIENVERLVHSCGFYKHKARDIVLGCQMLLSDYGGKVPGTMEELLRIPGVGRKTANLLLGDLYGAPGSVVCDTHCIRICGRLGLSQGKDPEKVEQQLLHGSGNFSVVILKKHLTSENNVPGFVLVKPAGMHQFFHMGNIRSGHGFQSGIGFKQGRSYQIHPGIGTLGRQTDGNHQLIVLAVVQGTGGFRITGFHNLNDGVYFFLHKHHPSCFSFSYITNKAETQQRKC